MREARGGAREHWALFKDPSGSSVAPLWNCLSCGSSEHNESGNESVSQSEEGRGKKNNNKKKRKGLRTAKSTAHETDEVGRTVRKYCGSFQS